MRLALLAAGLVVALLALSRAANVFRGSDQAPLESSSEVPAPAVDPQGVASPAVAVGPSALDALGAPDDPLPSALPLQAISEPSESRQAAEILARQVLAGGSELLPALITALQASGIGVIGPGNSVDAKPAEPWQGMTMQRWEVRTSAVMVLPERTVTFTLGDVAAFLVAVIPQLQGAPIEELIVKDLRALAESQVPTKRFFGQFIAALGRNASSHVPYDLLGDVDPQTIRVDGLQASLIFRRLSTDLLMMTADSKGQSGTTDKKAAFFDTLRDWVAPPAYAQNLPCTMDERTRTISDLIGLGSQLGFGGVQVGELGFRGVVERMQDRGVRGAEQFGTLSTIANTLLAYAQFIVTYAALDADVTMDAPPLVRTKKTAPAGERREVTAVVKLNIGNAQMLNCFRVVLNAGGLDFSLPNDGPVKGAVVSWEGVEGFDQAAAYLHGGSDAIVQFRTAGSQRVVNAVTGDDGKVQVGVEGRGQREDFSDNATEVRKSAAVRLRVALKGADLFGDIQEAASTAAGGLGGLPAVPISILMRMQWASVGHYRFPVTDWRDGPAEWTGTVKYTKLTKWTHTTSGKGGHSQRDYKDELTLNIDVTEPVDMPNVFGSSGAVIAGRAQANHTESNIASGVNLVNCNRVIRESTYTTTTTGEGTGSGTARVSLGISADGQYSITVNPDVTITYRSTSTAVQNNVDGRKQCGITTTSSSTSSSATGVARVEIQGDGMIDPRTPDQLTGTAEEKEGDITRTLTWNLQRK